MIAEASGTGTVAAGVPPVGLSVGLCEFGASVDGAAVGDDPDEPAAAGAGATPPADGVRIS